MPESAISSVQAAVPRCAEDDMQYQSTVLVGSKVIKVISYM